MWHSFHLSMVPIAGPQDEYINFRYFDLMFSIFWILIGAFLCRVTVLFVHCFVILSRVLKHLKINKKVTKKWQFSWNWFKTSLVTSYKTCYCMTTRDNTEWKMLFCKRRLLKKIYRCSEELACLTSYTVDRSLSLK